MVQVRKEETMGNQEPKADGQTIAQAIDCEMAWSPNQGVQRERRYGSSVAERTRSARRKGSLDLPMSDPASPMVKVKAKREEEREARTLEKGW